MKKLVSLLLAVCTCLSFGVILTACNEEHTHTLTKVEAVATTCETAGNTKYYTCTCGKYFSDAEGTTEIAKDGWVLTASGHTLTKTDAASATCETAGNTEYYTCTCGKYFSDAQGTTEIAKDSWVLSATGHSYSNEWSCNPTHHWKEATCEHTTEQGEYAEHTLINNECACGYVATTYTVTESEWRNLLTGDYLNNVTVNEQIVKRREGETEPYATTNNIWKHTEAAIYSADYEGDIFSNQYYYVKKDNIWYNLKEKTMLGISLGWQGEAMSNEQAESKTFAGDIGVEFVDLYSSFTYNSENKCYEVFEDEFYVKIYIEEGKLVKFEMNSVITSSAEGTNGEVVNGTKIYEVTTYTFSDYGTTTIDNIPEWTVAN